MDGELASAAILSGRKKNGFMSSWLASIWVWNAGWMLMSRC